MTFLSPTVAICSLWDEKAERGEALEPGRFYLFENIKCKSRGETGRLELVMHGNTSDDIVLIEENDPVFLEMIS